MNILAIDYGKKRIGLAWMQEGLDVVLPFGTIVEEKGKTSKEKLLSLIKEECIEKIVIGLPLGLDGKENDNTKKVRDFVEELKKEINISVEFIDERFSSLGADAMGGSVSRDEKAAMLILQSYLDKNSQ
ncbi:MAG: Holliday junction resolvase RuvX [Candidatus Magasanikbacteria bacterium CG_4_10_14_0_2_um_filter_37_12]|uniref:Putative pre-16S rRNA nuclease n=1 Tax=Candidatus Magasanikbacteria bacterium CG_4_10_14_0_2_um_filter_37_12 TaxID=1974637 RepID=A0A2M7V8M6_9BACT|nr:MAG: Holliday junction resolvase RuvX [Candidatus Magasanikbacteria bacterium CG_4_10_14_0_2_um_filter_37_12]